MEIKGAIREIPNSFRLFQFSTDLFKDWPTAYKKCYLLAIQNTI